MKYDLILVHAPSVYDFRQCDDILFAYLSNSDSVHVSPIFEMPPVGVIAIKQHLQLRGFTTEFFNVASHMLHHPKFSVSSFFEKSPADYLGIDLHWLASAHGVLELAKLYKEVHPSAKTVVGGIAASYYHEELIEYQQIDYVIRGYDALLPLEILLKAKNSPDALSQVPNLTWKNSGGLCVNEMTHIPAVYTAVVDWAQVLSNKRSDMTPYNIVIPQAGCEYNCRFCGGSRYFFNKYMGLGKVAQKKPEILGAELKSIERLLTRRHTLTMINFWHEYPRLFEEATDVFMNDKIHCVHFSLNTLPSIEKGQRLGLPAKAILELSPDSHSLHIAKTEGRGKYTMEQMEEFIDALIDDVYAFEIYFMIGLPHQDVHNVMETVDYCEHLLKKYQGKLVTPFLCPMLPFLDPGSEFYDNPEEWGYTIFHHTLEDHRQALLSMNWKHRLNYETRWLSRDELVKISYESVRGLTLLKNRYGLLPDGIASILLTLIDSTTALLKEIDGFYEMPNGELKEKVGKDLRNKIRDYNRQQFKMVRSQQRPIDFGFARQQWFDTDEAFNRIMNP